MEKNKHKFYDILFLRGEGIGYQTEFETYRKNRVLVHNGEQDNYNFNYHFYCINPIHPTIDHCPDPNKKSEGPNIPRIKSCNVTAYRNFAIEFDADTLKDQVEKLKISKMPYSAVVFSGKKSLHCPIALEEAVTVSEYTAIFDAIEATLLKYNLQLDPHCSNPNRLTRAPGQIRFDVEVEQKLVTINGTIPNQTLFDWFEENDVNWKDYIPAPRPPREEWSGPGNAADEERWDVANKFTEKKHKKYNPCANTGNWVWLFDLGTNIYKTDLDIESGIRMTESNFGTTSDGSGGTFNIEIPIRKGWQWADKNRVEKVTIQSKREWRIKKQSEVRAVLENNQQKYINNYYEQTK